LLSSELSKSFKLLESSSYSNDMQPDTYYHIYNHANGSENLFREAENYRYFLQQWAKYIEPVAGTYAYCLMPNHIHFLIRTKPEQDVSANLNYSEDLPFGKFQTFQKVVSKQFANLFSSYTQAYNKMHGRRGSLFVPNFKRKQVSSDRDLTTVTHYIHSNPVHHGFVGSIDLWKWSSYHTLLSTKPTLLERNETISWFGNRNDFLSMHQQAIEIKEKEWID